jgi:hypothetical protein
MKRKRGRPKDKKKRVQVCVTLEPELLKRIDAENAKTGAPRGKILERMLYK